MPRRNLTRESRSAFRCRVARSDARRESVRSNSREMSARSDSWIISRVCSILRPFVGDFLKLWITRPVGGLLAQSKEYIRPALCPESARNRRRNTAKIFFRRIGWLVDSAGEARAGMRAGESVPCGDSVPGWGNQYWGGGNSSGRGISAGAGSQYRALNQRRGGA